MNLFGMLSSNLAKRMMVVYNLNDLQRLGHRATF